MRRTLAVLATIGLAAGAAAQERSGGFDIIFVEEVAEPEAIPSASPSPTPTPPPLVVPRYIPPPPPDLVSYEDRALDAVTRPELTAFSGEREFQRYFERFDEIRDRRRTRWGWSGGRGAQEIVVAAATQDTPQEEELCTDPQVCPDVAQADSIAVTAAKAAAPNITNVQSVGVDEGDIVKQIGDYFLVLQDGRLFAVNTKSMQLTDRIDAYRRDADGEPIGADWYDEMLVQDDHVLVTAYSYADSATELSVFRLDQASGKLARLGVFLISSDDYYDSDNYATRIVGDRLVLYAPYELDALRDRASRPVIRRWLGPKTREDAQGKGTPLIDARRLYWPVMRTGEPTIHTVSVCPLGAIATRDLRCETTGFVAPAAVQMFVSPRNVYLWATTVEEAPTWRFDDCAKQDTTPPRPAARDVPPGVVYRVPVFGGDPSLLPIRGGVFDQFSMDENRGSFRALARWTSAKCDAEWEDPVEVALLDEPGTAFTTTYRESSGREFRAVPAPGKRMVENRFVEDWLVYGGRDGWGGYPPDADEGPQAARAVAIPLRHPERAQVLEPGHEFVRVERVGNDVVMNGYRDPEGLRVTLLKLGNDARIGSQLFLKGRFESEGRSHAFNSTVNPDASGIMGIPTVQSEGQSGRWWWRSQGSDISFLSFDSSGHLASLGALPGKDEDETKVAGGYACEVSCIDWYGNSRPIFSEGRIFGLIATELVEARVAAGKIEEKARIDLTGPVAGK